ncbi:MAG: 50S ribosomal protein L24 [Ignavibacteria bacterium GWF2_33_9]|nr:MAG: 50S ribosomal protein L24 [Ignavibacteria bacterium GWF2_33_9]
MKLKIKKNDIVHVIAGNDKGKQGRVLEIYSDKMRILVEGVNIRTKASRPSQENPQGGLIHKEQPIHYSNVQLLDSEKKPTRTGIRISEKDTVKGKPLKVRFAKSNGKDI